MLFIRFKSIKKQTLCELTESWSMMEILTLCFFAFIAGFIDSIVGGGGLIQTPALLITLPNTPVPPIMGTAKISSIAGTTMSSFQYALRVTFNWRVLLTTIIAAGIGSFIGARLISFLHPSVVKPVIFVMLILVFTYLIIKKDFGQSNKIVVTDSKSITYCILFGFIVGVYDGFLGPGTGSFLILFFVSVVGFDFLLASAHAKVVNLATNLGAVIYFGWSGNIMWQYALPMAFCNLSGAFFGSKAALLRGNEFVRQVFLGVIFLMIIRYGFDIF